MPSSQKPDWYRQITRKWLFIIFGNYIDLLHPRKYTNYLFTMVIVVCYCLLFRNSLVVNSWSVTEQTTRLWRIEYTIDLFMEHRAQDYDNTTGQVITPTVIYVLKVWSMNLNSEYNCQTGIVVYKQSNSFSELQTRVWFLVSAWRLVQLVLVKSDWWIFVSFSSLFLNKVHNMAFDDFENEVIKVIQLALK